jgi:hypothetical protein
MNLRNVERKDVNWIIVVQDMVQWRDLENSGSINIGNKLTS